MEVIATHSKSVTKNVIYAFCIIYSSFIITFLLIFFLLLDSWISMKDALFHVAKFHLQNYMNIIDNYYSLVWLKVAFLRKWNSFFKSPNLQKTILNLKFKIPAHNIILLWVGILNFKFRIVFWNISFWRLGDLKNESHSLKKATFRKIA